jgi:uncharacterized membrane protein
VNISASIERIVLALWVGGLWSIGLVVAPELFRSLESRQVAGAIAGNIFTVMNYSGLIAGLILLSLAHRQYQYRWRSFRQWRTLLIVTMLILVVISQFVLTPMMQEIKQARLVTAVVSLDMHNQFAILHGLSSILYLLTGILGLVLVAAGAAEKSN